MKTLEQIKQELDSKFGIQSTIEGSGLTIPKEKWLEIAKFLRDDPNYRLDYLSSVTGVDYVQYLESVYHLFSFEKKEPDCLAIKIRTERENGHIPSAVPIWRSAEYQEREIYDLFGIHFDGHPDLRRILMWDGFEFHPMRKDYVADEPMHSAG